MSSPALEAGIINYASVYDDVPVTFGDYDEDWNVEETAADGTVVKKVAPRAWPANLPNTYAGLTTVNQAIITSKNTVAVRVLQELTIDKSFDFVKNKLGMSSFIDSYTAPNGTVYTDKLLAPLALGQMNFGLTVEEITAAYGIFQNNGVYNKPRTFLAVYDNEGNLILGQTVQLKVNVGVDLVLVGVEVNGLLGNLGVYHAVADKSAGADQLVLVDGRRALGKCTCHLKGADYATGHIDDEIDRAVYGISRDGNGLLAAEVTAKVDLTANGAPKGNGHALHVASAYGGKSCQGAVAKHLAKLGKAALKAVCENGVYHTVDLNGGLAVLLAKLCICGNGVFVKQKFKFFL